jgi:hypothetical protein
MAEAEAQHEQLKREMRRIRREIRTRSEPGDLEAQLIKLTAQARGLAAALVRQRAMTEYLMQCETYGGIQ